jgi:hypothetical protein
MHGIVVPFVLFYLIPSSRGLLLSKSEVERMPQQRQAASHNGEEDGDGWAKVPQKGGRTNGAQNASSHQTEQWSGAPLAVEPIPQDPLNCQFQPFLLLLAGLPGSGKSTFARTLVEAMPYKVRKRR